MSLVKLESTEQGWGRQGAPKPAPCLLSRSPTNTQALHGQISMWLWVHLPMATMDDPSASLPRSSHFSLP